MDTTRRLVLAACLLAALAPRSTAGDVPPEWDHALVGTWFAAEIAAEVVARPDGGVVIAGHDARRDDVTLDVLVRVDKTDRIGLSLSVWVEDDGAWFVHDGAGELHLTRDGDVRRLQLEVPLGGVARRWGARGVLEIDVQGDARRVRRVGGRARVEVVSRGGHCSGRAELDGAERAVQGPTRLRMRELAARELPVTLRRALREAHDRPTRRPTP